MGAPGKRIGERFEDWAKEFNKTYETRALFDHRLATFEENVRMIEQHNAEYDNGESTYTMGLNQFSDLDYDEFSEIYLLKNWTGWGWFDGGNYTYFKEDRNFRAPSHIDFREEGKVTPVKNQGQCGSCWAFSATGAMEGMWMNSHSTLYSLSEQQMLDCGQGSCNGGYMDSAWQTVRNGANTEADYPYEARDGQCRAKSNSFVATNSGSQRVSHSESSLESAMAQVGYSISVAIHVGSSFQHYSGGIFSDPQCQYGQLNHGVLAVGYDHGSNWIVKNSWGGSWGEGGYIRMKQGENSCGITKDPMYPIV